MPRPRTNPLPDTPKVLDKALRVLDAFAEQSSAWSEAALRDHVDIPSTTLHRILRSFEHAGYLTRGGDGRYRLGVAAVRLGQRASASLDLPAVLEPHVRDLAQRTEELVILAVPDLTAARATYIATADCPSGCASPPRSAPRVPLTAGATAKTLLAFQPETHIDTVLKAKPKRLAAGTITDRAEIRRAARRHRRARMGLQLGGNL